MVCPAPEKPIPGMSIFRCPEELQQHPECFVTRCEEIRLAMLEEAARRGYKRVIFVESDMLWFSDPRSIFNDIPSGCDMGMTFRNDGHPVQAGTTPKHLNSGVMYFRNSDALRSAWRDVIKMTKDAVRTECSGGLNQKQILRRFPPLPCGTTKGGLKVYGKGLYNCATQYEAHVLHPLDSQWFYREGSVPCLDVMLTAPKHDWCLNGVECYPAMAADNAKFMHFKGLSVDGRKQAPFLALVKQLAESQLDDRKLGDLQNVKLMTTFDTQQLQRCADHLCAGDKHFRPPLKISQRGDGSDWFERNLSWTSLPPSPRYFMSPEEQRGALNATSGGRNITIYVIGDSCVRELLNSLLAMWCTDPARRAYWRCFTRPKPGDYEHIARCGPTPARHSSILGAAYDRVARLCDKKSDGPGIDLRTCGRPTNYTETIALGGGAFLKVQFQFKTYFITGPMDRIVFSEIALDPPDLSMISLGSSWGEMYSKRDKNDAFGLKSVFKFTSQLRSVYPSPRPLIWLLPRHERLDYAARNTGFLEFMSANGIVAFGSPTDIANVRYLGHCHAGNLTDARAFALGNFLLSPSICKAPLPYETS